MSDSNVTYVALSDSSDRPKTSHDQDVDDLLSELRDVGASASIRVYKCREGSQNADEFIVRVPADKYDLPGLMDFLRAKYGGGDYRLMMYKPGHRGVWENKLISLAREIAPANLPATVNGGNNEILQGIALMMQNSNAQFERLLTALARPDVDPYEQQKKQLEMLKLQKDILGGGNTGIATPIPQNDPIEMMTKMVAMITGFKGIMGEMGGVFGGGAEEDSILGVAKTLGPQFLSVIQNHQKIEAAKVTTTGAQLMRQRRPNPAPRPGTDNPALPPAPAGGILPAPALAVLTRHAADDTDPDMVAAELKAHLTPEIIAAIRAPDAFKRFARAHGVILDAPEWWMDLLGALRDLLEDDNLPVNHPTGTHNDAGQNAANRDGVVSDQ